MQPVEAVRYLRGLRACRGREHWGVLMPTPIVGFRLTVGNNY